MLVNLCQKGMLYFHKCVMCGSFYFMHGSGGFLALIWSDDEIRLPKSGYYLHAWPFGNCLKILISFRYAPNDTFYNISNPYTPIQHIAFLWYWSFRDMQLFGSVKKGAFNLKKCHLRCEIIVRLPCFVCLSVRKNRVSDICRANISVTQSDT